MENRNEFQAPVAPPVSSERSEGHSALWDDPDKEKRKPFDRTVVEPPEELALPDVSTLLGYNSPPPDYSDHVKWGGLGKTGGNSQQNGEREGEASAEPSAKVAQPAKAEPPSPQKAPPTGAANKQTGVLEGGALLYVVTVLVTGAVVGYVSAWLFEEANQIVVRSGPSPDGPWRDAGVAPADAYAGLVGNGLMEALVSDYSADISASMEGFTPPRLGGFELGEGTPPEPTVTPRLEVGNTIFSTPLTDVELLESITTPTQQPDARDFVLRIGIGYELGVPSHWPEDVSNSGNGIRYINPDNTHDRVRLAPGDPQSSNPGQRVPYAVRQYNGGFFDRDGNEVESKYTQESHIPIEEFEFIEGKNLRRR